MGEGPRIGSLCSGYGGLEQGIEAVYGGSTAWVSDIDKGACKILAHRYPDAPNIGDMTAVDWSQVEPVDILCGGTPCQDLSHAGRRAGMTEGTRSNLWVAMREAIAQLRPTLVIWENVRGAYSATADSAVEPCPGCVGDGSGVSLRALGRVLGDLSDLGYDASWHGLRAADVGAPHGRFRVFVAATDPQGNAGRLAYGDDGAAAVSRRLRRGAGWPAVTGQTDSGRAPADVAGRGLLPTPAARDWKGAGPADLRRHDPNLSAISALLPTPAVNDMGEGKTVEAWDEWTAKMQAKHGNGNGHGASLAIEAQRVAAATDYLDRLESMSADNVSLDRIAEQRRLLGTPTATMKRRSDEFADGREANPEEFALRHDGTWGDYAPAIARWERTLGRPAPEPTMTSTKGNPRLSPRFVEWLMGLPAGWVTDVPGLTRNEALKALGNGVVPQQAAEALRVMASWEVAA